MENVTQKVADFVCEATVGSLPREVQQEAVRSFVNWAGCCLSGCTHDAVETALATVMELSGPQIAPVLGRKERLDPLNAALLNCMSSAVHTFDDTHLKSIIHPAGPVIAAAMAVAAKHVVTGRELKTINRRIAAAIAKGMVDLLNELRDEDSSARMQFREALSGLVNELLNSPEQRKQLNEAKNRLLQHPDIQAWIAAVWHEVSQATLNDLAQPNSKIRMGIERAILAIGQAVGSDEAMQKHIDSVIERTARHLVSWRSEIGGFISEVVKSWDSRALTDRLELVVGSDLQYIRMNGTVVGALVGCLLFLSVQLFS